jgi:hypothetical protein
MIDNNIIDLDKPPTFRREEWIGQNKVYSRKDLPYFVIDACNPITRNDQVSSSEYLIN